MASLAEAPSHVSPEDAFAPPFVLPLLMPLFTLCASVLPALLASGDDSKDGNVKNPETTTGCCRVILSGSQLAGQPSATTSARAGRPAPTTISSG